MGRQERSGWWQGLDRLVERRWSRAARMAGTLPLGELNALRRRARRLSAHLSRFLHVADGRLARPADNTAPDAPHDAEWAWRPAAWSGRADRPGLAGIESGASFGEGLRVFHDCLRGEVMLRQLPNLREADAAPFGLVLDVLGFEGSYLSLSLALPPDGWRPLTRNHLIGVAGKVRMENPVELFLRLNVRHGPNTDQIVREVPPGREEVDVAFDLALSKLNGRAVDEAWLDVILERPAANRVAITELALHRRPRADF